MLKEVDMPTTDNWIRRYHPRVLKSIKADERCWIQTEEEAKTRVAAFPEWQKLWENPSE